MKMRLIFEARDDGKNHTIAMDVDSDNWLNEDKNNATRRQGVIDAANSLLRSLNLEEIDEAGGLGDGMVNRLIRAEALNDAADLAFDPTHGMDGSIIREEEDRGFMQRHNVLSAVKWLRKRAEAERQGKHD